MTNLLRRTATGLFAAACGLLLLVQAFPFNATMPLLGIPLRFSYALFALLALAVAGLALNLDRRGIPAALCAAAGALMATSFAVTMGGLPMGGRVAFGFILYLVGVGALAAAGLMAGTSHIEDRRHGPAPRTFTVQPREAPADAEPNAAHGATPQGPEPPTAAPPAARRAGSGGPPAAAAPAGPQGGSRASAVPPQAGGAAAPKR